MKPGKADTAKSLLSEKRRLESDLLSLNKQTDELADIAVSSDPLNKIASDLSALPRSDWRKHLRDIKHGGRPWERNRPTTDVGTHGMDKSVAQHLDDAFQVAANRNVPPHLISKAKKAFTDPGAIEVGTIEEKNRLIHLYHLLQKPPPLVYAGASVYGHYLRALHEKTFLLPFGKEGSARFRVHVENMLPQLETLTPFVINHNWKAVLEQAGEPDTGEDDFKLPADDATVFEFAMEGMRVLALATDMPEMEDIGLHIWVRLDKQWICLGAEKLRQPLGKGTAEGEETDAFYCEVRAQIRAACAVMEAEVAETEVVRADYRRNEKRQRQGQHKFFDYHVVNLARRHKLSRAEMPANDEKRQSPRLHFVKAHWRHFDNYKVRIKWHYRGDADLGFIDKEYRL